MPELEMTTRVRVFDCGECGSPIALTEKMEKTFRDTHQGFYCPMGHVRAYLAESESERYKRELGEANKRLAARQATLDQTNKALEDERKKGRRALKRAIAGTCPCCRRNFVDVQRHMKSKHPENLPKTDPIDEKINAKAKP